MWCLDDDKEGGGEKKRQTRGGKGIVRAKKKVEKERKICLARESRGKKKYTTVVTGLASYGMHCYGYIVKFLQLFDFA